jgi:hypothetical protein
LLSIRGARPGQPVEHLVNRVSIVQCEAVERVAYFAVLYPGEESPRWAFCVPRLAQRGGITVAAGPLQGWLDTAEAGLVRAWARDAANSNMPVPVEVVVDGVVLGSTLANHYRADLATAGYGHGRNGIEFRFPVPLHFVARISSWAKSALRIDIYLTRTYSGRPSFSIRLSDATAMATSVVCRPSVRERSASPITRL